MSKEETTVDELARMIQGEFVSLRSDFHLMRQFNSAHFASIHSDLSDIKLRLDNTALKMDLDSLDKRVQVLEHRQTR